MLDLLADDIDSVFFGADFARTFTRYRPLADGVEFAAIFGMADEEVLEGRSLAAARVLRLPANVDLRAGDVVTAVQAIDAMGVSAGTQFRVLEMPVRVNDGMELEALLGSVTP